jgi:membrane-associated phospholipid phosphatase
MPARSSPEVSELDRPAGAAPRRAPPTLAGRFRALLPLKAAVQAVFSLLFWVGYVWLSRHAVFPLRAVPGTWLDRAGPFSPGPWAWVYLSQFLLAGGLPWLIDNRGLLWRYVAAGALMSVASFLLFVFFPVASPRPAGLPDTGPMAWIVRGDGAFNAFPSLHAGFVVLIADLGWRIFRRPAVSAVLGVWAVLILYATLATRQHYAWDLAAGLLIGGLANFGAARLLSGSAAT